MQTPAGYESIMWRQSFRWNWWKDRVQPVLPYRLATWCGAYLTTRWFVGAVRRVAIC